MLQVFQNLQNGDTELKDIPVPQLEDGKLQIQTARSLVSAGTERMMVQFGRANWINKARSQPDKVRMVLDKVVTDGVGPTLNSVRNKLAAPLPMGYSNVGTVRGIGKGVSGYKEGERVVSNGHHAEVVNVSQNLCARIPDNVSDDEAAFTVVGAIGLQGIRLVNPTLGETVVVLGLGLIGLVTAQLLRANGCKVIGIDPVPGKLEMARQFGIDVIDVSGGQDPVSQALARTDGVGVDAVLITASTASHEPVHQAATMCRKRGRIVLVGVTGLTLSRDDFYKKELSLQVSCSYGPGRYEKNYEEHGLDYPIGYIRWTEQRNMQAVLDLLANGSLDLKPLITHRYSIEAAENAYQTVSSDPSALGILLDYPGVPPDRDVRVIEVANGNREKGKPISGAATVCFIGAGSYATSTLIPAFRKTGARLKSIGSNKGASGFIAGERSNFESTTTDMEEIYNDSETDVIVITTPHHLHADQVEKSLGAGKHVFVEKPLCLNLQDLDKIQQTFKNSTGGDEKGACLMVGFNRRFSPHVVKMKSLLEPLAQPRSIVITVNAGHIPGDHWTQDREIGGGRLIGEACHFIDLVRHLGGHAIVDANVVGMKSDNQDTFTIQLKLQDGTIGTIHYFANGCKRFPKERVEVFCGGRILQLDNYRSLTGYGWDGFKKMKTWKQDKGQVGCVSAFLSAVKYSDRVPIAVDELFEVSRITIELSNTLFD